MVPGFAGARVPYWRLSSFYLFYFATLGALVPFWGLYLKARGFTATEIGELMATIMATKIVAPYVWGWIADHRGRRMPIIRLASVLAALTFAGVFWTTGYWTLAAVMSAFSFFWNAALPQFEAATLNHLGERTHLYTRIRVWGSVGFIVAVVSLGPLLDRYGAGLLPRVVLVLMGTIWLASLAVPEQATGYHRLAQGSFMRVVTQPQVLALFAACMLMQMSHGPYYTFYSIYLEGHGFSGFAIGQLWAFGVLAEVLLFIVTHRLLTRWGLRGPFIISFGLATLRWLLIAWFPDRLPLLLFAQGLHAASFGLYHAVAIILVHRFFVGRFQGRGQALYSSLSFGAGGALGSLLGGYAWDGLSPVAAYLGAAVCSTLGMFLVWRWVGHPDENL